MNLETDIIPYVDGNNLVAPNPVVPGTIRASDNGTCFSSEYFILMEMNYPDPDMSYLRAKGWEALIRTCMQVPGLTVRAPGDRAIDAPDNVYAILAASKVLSRPAVAQDILSYGKKHLGFYDPTGVPGVKLGAFLWRQPQIVFAMYCAANLYKPWKFWLWPLAVYTALVIGVSCWRVPVDHTDERRLSWLLIQTTKESLLCRLASKLWYNRLHRDYSDGMRTVRGIYYKGNPHPFVTYNKD